MPSFGIWEAIVLAILVLPVVYLACGGLKRELRKMRKMWADAAPRTEDQEQG